MKKHLSEVVAKATPAPFYSGYGEGICFHHGNRASICKAYNDGGEETEVTVAEVWPTTGAFDCFDAALFAHSRNYFERLVETSRKLSLSAKKVNAAQHAGIKISDEDWSDLHYWTNVMNDVLSEAEQVEVPEH